MTPSTITKAPASSSKDVDVHGSFGHYHQVPGDTSEYEYGHPSGAYKGIAIINAKYQQGHLPKNKTKLRKYLPLQSELGRLCGTFMNEASRYGGR